MNPRRYQTAAVLPTFLQAVVWAPKLQIDLECSYFCKLVIIQCCCSCAWEKCQIKLKVSANWRWVAALTERMNQCHNCWLTITPTLLKPVDSAQILLQFEIGKPPGRIDFPGIPAIGLFARSQSNLTTGWPVRLITSFYWHHIESIILVQ